jgi:hypothetical protein
MRHNFVHSCYEAVTVTGPLLSVNANLSLWNTEITSIQLHCVINGMNVSVLPGSWQRIRHDHLSHCYMLSRSEAATGIARQHVDLSAHMRLTEIKSKCELNLSYFWIYGTHGGVI